MLPLGIAYFSIVGDAGRVGGTHRLADLVLFGVGHGGIWLDDVQIAAHGLVVAVALLFVGGVLLLPVRHCLARHRPPTGCSPSTCW